MRRRPLALPALVVAALAPPLAAASCGSGDNATGATGGGFPTGSGGEGGATHHGGSGGGGSTGVFMHDSGGCSNGDKCGDGGVCAGEKCCAADSKKVYAVVDDTTVPHPGWTECRTDNDTSAAVSGACSQPK